MKSLFVLSAFVLLAGCGALRQEFVPVRVDSTVIGLPGSLGSEDIHAMGVPIDGALKELDFAKSDRRSIYTHFNLYQMHLGRKTDVAMFWDGDGQVVVGIAERKNDWALDRPVKIDPADGTYRVVEEPLERQRLDTAYRNQRLDWIEITERDLNVAGAFFKSLVSFGSCTEDTKHKMETRDPNGNVVAEMVMARSFKGSKGYLGICGAYLLDEAVCGFVDERERADWKEGVENCPTHFVKPTPDGSKVVTDTGVFDLGTLARSAPIVSQGASLQPLLYQYAIDDSFQRIALLFETETGGVLITADFNVAAL